MKKWDVTITKMGSIEVEAETQNDAIMKVATMNDSQIIKWEDDWNAVDANQISE